ncbi:hypothetical protein [Thalassoroseus pseudoceratinae]|uniref:hypothetical protein n=1 Tax=Thalassoroseus pseudoceratinae TaxID=2713176 RepID=UPI00142103CA|nr:hypothetical protein [Thalassoroseus pseudoceratinae]
MPPTVSSPSPPPTKSSATGSGWIVSAFIHGIVLGVLVTSGLPSCGDSSPGIGPSTEDGLREVGIYLKPENPVEQPISEDVPTPESVVEPVPDPLESTTQSTELDEQTLNNLTKVPEPEPTPLIGMGAKTAPVGGTPATELEPSELKPSPLKPNPQTPPPSGGVGAGEVNFMGLTSKAERIVYVIDTSDSMRLDDAIDYAKAKLKESVNRLDRSQQFQIVAYSDVIFPMRLRNDQRLKLYRAIDHNLVLADRFISTIVAEGGTKHMPALELAFSFEPDVVFFLTDADSEVQPSELRAIRNRLNRGKRAAIHCIKFDQGPDLQPEETNSLRILAVQNRGTYTYKNTEKLR